MNLRCGSISGIVAVGPLLFEPLEGLWRRVDVPKHLDVVNAMYGLERIARERAIERKLLHLIKTCVSQINRCATASITACLIERLRR